MSLTPEWTHRLDRWRDEMTRHLYRPLGEIALKGFATLEQLTAQEAATRDYRPMPAGAPWGAKWE
jgi:alpha-mannosidase